ncbi:lycopene cyclase family protein [Catalinimonas niigatensis]|uniref:lycopene cyclase family protein n=1 Tax=Catalinimonas niigatensis TaxID=1397264 RepID=UPI00266650C6|nr:lycopene cyclase family protein [Catalinimonas niigatensis]WPP52276.1 lycopene cyclase family protein [Catalinimonas niigatensis]
MILLSRYDYIIAGGGASGLSLLHHILQSPLRDKSILVVDKTRKEQNDRTWCFWEAGKNPFESIVYRQWQYVDFYSANFSKTLDLAPYAYKMIRGIDFYEYVQAQASQSDRVHFLQADVQAIEDTENGAVLRTDVGNFEADWVFSSIRADNEKAQAKGHHYLLQHFKGWVIRTPAPFFNPEQATLMDFRIAQNGDCRFMYVLPINERTALVEYTLFSADLLSEETYDQALMDYLRSFYQLDDYEIEHEEFGIIPMTDMPYPSAGGKFIVNIGTAGGITKPSTGYTFTRIQQDSQRMVQRLSKGESPQRHINRWQQRFKIYDSTLLNVMVHNFHPSSDVFTHLFRNNPPQRVFRFLDEQTNFWEEIQVANSVPKLPFVRGLTKALIK